jgi:hypothetical protein
MVSFTVSETAWVMNACCVKISSGTVLCVCDLV